MSMSSAAQPCRVRRPALVGAVVIAVVWVSACHGHGGAPAAAQATASRAAPVVVEPARRGDLPVTLSGVGAVTPLAAVTVKSRLDGQLMTVAFREGDTVTAGDLLAQIDPRPFQVQLEQAQGQMTRDQALLANAKVDLQRYRRLVAEDSIPKQQLDTQEALVRQYEGTVQIDQAQVDDATLQLTYARITAPLSGRLGLRLVDPGNMVHASDPGGLVTITQLQPIGVIFTIPEDAVPPVLAKLRDGVPLAVEAYDRAQTRLLATGSLLTLDNAIDSSSGTLKLKAEFPNDDGALYPNQFVNARLLLDVRRDATIVPTGAIQRGSQGPFVYVVGADNTAALRPVQLGVSEGDDTAIDSGVAPGEPVVVDGVDGLRPGRPVTVQARAAPTSAPEGA